MHLTHPPQTMSFFHLPTSSASAFDVGYPGVWGIQSWGMKEWICTLSPRKSFPIDPPCISWSLSASFCCLQSLTPSPPPLSNIYLSFHQHPLETSFLLIQDEGHYSLHCTHCSFNHSYTSSTTVTSYPSPTAHSTHFIKEPFRMLL